VRAWGVALAAFGVALALHLLWDAMRLWVPVFVYLGLVAVLYAVGIVLFVVTRRLSAAYEARSEAVAV
jgi:Na+/glutamate symporter